MIRLKGFLRTGLHLARFACGYLAYARTGVCAPSSFLSMRQLFCLTNGRFNDSMALANRWLHEARPAQATCGILGELSAADVAAARREIDRNGFCVFPQRLDAELCHALRSFALDTPLRIVGDQQTGPTFKRYDPDHPVAVKYDCEQQTLLECEAAQQVVFDPGLREIAQAYFRAEPVQDLAAMWWSTAAGAGPSSAAAQLYHFDMDRLKFLKFFVYLTEVDTDTGPHCYIARSHRRKPAPLLRLDRIPDDEMFRHYRREEEVEITGPIGTVAAVDTRGFHKGKPLQRGHRLMLQVEFATDLFGCSYPRLRLNERFGSFARTAIQRHPYTYCNYVT
jgi:hypothetical protein